MHNCLRISICDLALSPETGLPWNNHRGLWAFCCVAHRSTPTSPNQAQTRSQHWAVATTCLVVVHLWSRCWHRHFESQGCGGRFSVVSNNGTRPGWDQTLTLTLQYVNVAWFPSRSTLHLLLLSNTCRSFKLNPHALVCKHCKLLFHWSGGLRPRSIIGQLEAVPPMA